MLIEDNRLARDRLASLLNGQPSFTVVAAAGDVTTALARVQETQPHVVLVDAGLGRDDVDRCLMSVRNMAPEARVILTDIQPALQEIVAFIKAGANGIILKDATADEFVGTIRSVAEGTDVVPASLGSMLVSYIAGRAIVRAPADAPPAAVGTTKREQEVMDLIAHGFANKEIAQRLDIATHTVKTHVHHILEKLGLRSRLEISAHTHRVGLLIRTADLETPRLMVKAG